MSRRTLCRRLTVLERRTIPAGRPDVVVAVALAVGDADLVLRGSDWIACPDAARLMAQARTPVKVYAGFDPREG